MDEIWAIILAAGESKRMGVPKMFLIFNGKTMLENVIANVTASEVNNTIVVMGAESDSLMDLIAKTSVMYCYNDNYREGMLSSVKCGLSAAGELRSLADKFSDDVLEVATNESGILRDFDTYEEYMKEINQIH